jgi:hypothetical protein
LSKFRIIGAGYNTILKTFANGSPVITLDCSITWIDTWAIENLTFDGNNQASDGLYLNATTLNPITKGLVIHVRMNYVKKGIHIGGTSYNYGFRDISILNSINGVIIESTGQAAYNTFDRLEVSTTGTNFSGDDGYAIIDNGGNNYFRDTVVEAPCKFSGQNDYIDITVETLSCTYTASPNVSVLFVAGAGSVIQALLTNIDPAKANIGLNLFGKPQTVLSLRAIGTTFPTYLIDVDTGATETVILNADSGGGYTADQYISEAKKRNITCLNGNWFGKFGVKTVYGTAAPTTGTWVVGDRCYNNTPTVGQPKSWVCTVAGTPGTWVSEGNL